MDRRFLRYYEEELQILRDLGGEFARTHAAVAGRLGLDAFACADPYVERLLEGVAFLTARVQLKLDAEFPRFTDHLLEMVQPDYLAPTPSIALVALEPDLAAGTLESGYLVPRGTRLFSRLGPRMPTRCTFTTCHDVTLWPIAIREVRHLTGAALTTAGVPRRGEAQAAIRITLASEAGIPLERLALDSLVLHLQGGRIAHRLYEALLASGIGLVLQPQGAEPPWRLPLGRDAIRRKGFSDDEAILPSAPESFQGYRLLREYFACPERYLFVELSGLQPALRRTPGDTLELFVLLDRIDGELEESLRADNLALFVTPAVNLFPRPCEPIGLDPAKPDHHVVPDRVRPRDYEVHSILEVVGEGGGAPQVFTPFYRTREGGDLRRERAHYVVERRPRLVAAEEARKGGPRSSYQGGEVFLQLVDPNEAPWRGGLQRLLVRALCTNRDLPLFMPLPVGESHFTSESGAPLRAIRCLGEPTRPLPSLAIGEPARARPNQPFGETPWRLISHLALNYLSLLDDGPEQGATGLRELLRLYADFAPPALAKQVDGIRHVAHAPVVDRVPAGGPITFGRGLGIRLTLEEAMFEGGSAFLLGAVLEQFFRRYVSINAFTATTVSTLERGEIMRWPARTGRRHLL